MLAICTGISGTDKRAYLIELQEYAERYHDRELEVFDLGTFVEEEAKRLFQQSHIAISISDIAKKVLDLPKSTARQLGATASEQILRQINGRRGNYVISTHACFRWKKSLMLTVDSHYLDQYEPDVFLTMTDEPYKIRATLQQDPKWVDKLSVEDIAAWQGEEKEATRILAGYRRKEWMEFKVGAPKKEVFDYLFKIKGSKRRLPPPMPSPHKTVYCTAISGTKAREYLRAFCSWAMKTKQHEITLLDLGATVVRVAQKYKRSITKQNILREGEQDLNTWRQEALRILRDERRKHGDCIILGHSCFRSNFKMENLLLGFDPEQELITWSLINPDVYVTITDNILSNKVRLNREDQAEGLDLSLREIAMWHDEECFFTRLIAENFKKPYYIMPLSEPFETLDGIIFQQDRKRIYLSFPITEVLKKEEKEREEIFSWKNELRENLRKSYVVFDPLDILDGALPKILDSETKFHHLLKDHIIEFNENADGSIERATKSLQVFFVNSEKLKIKEAGITLSRGELEKAVGYINDQIVDRDYRLIDQSDWVAVYYPVPEVSAGVISEVVYGFSHGRSVFAWWFSREVSPFLEAYLTGLCFSKEDLLNMLEKYSKGQ